MQPFTYAEPGGLTVLKMLHDLDIQDKHKDLLTVSADLNGISFDGSFFEYEDHETTAVPRLEMYEGVKFADGAVLGTLHSGATIKTLGQMILRPSMQVQLAWAGQTLDVGVLLPQFVNETRRCLDILLHGLAAPEPDDADWVPMEFGPAAPDAT
jgi:hypothetical protein